MIGIGLDDIRMATRSLFRARGFAAPALLLLALGSALALSVLGLFSLAPLPSLTVESTLSLDFVREPGWGSRWGAWYWSPEQIQSLKFEGLLTIMAMVAAAGLLVACLGIAVLVLIRGSTRRGELALLSALGAARRRLTWQLLAEGVLLAALGGGAGLSLGLVGLTVLEGSWPHGLGDTGIMDLDPWVVLLTVGVPMLSAAALPTLAMASMLRRPGLSRALTASAGVGDSRASLRLQDCLAVIALAVAVALLIAAGSLTRGVLPELRAASGSLSISPASIVALDLPTGESANEGERADSYQRLLDRIAAIPGVEAESLASPGTWLGVGSKVIARARCGRCYRGQVYLPVIPAYVRLHAVSAGYFRQAGVAVRRGREFSADDRVGTSKVALVNGTFAASHFEDGDALGREVQIGGAQAPWYTVVGVVDDITGRGIGPSSRPEPAVYVSMLQEPPRAADLAISSSLSSPELEAVVQLAVSGLSAEPAIGAVLRMSDYLAHQVAPVGWIGRVLGGLGAGTLILAILGVASVMHYRVSRRRREIGLRRALGARRRRIVAVFLLETGSLVAVGVALGSWSSTLLLGWLDLILPDVRLFDPVVYAVVFLALSVAAVIGGLLPARSAARIDPAVALHTE